MIKKGILLDIIYFLTWFVFLLYQITDSYIFLAGYYLLITFSVFFLKLNRRYVLIFMSILFLFLTISYFTPEQNSLLDIYNFFLGLSAFFLALILYESKNAIYTTKLIFILYTLLLLYAMLRGGGNPNIYNDVLATGSRNIVNAIYVVLLSLIILAHKGDFKKISIYYPIITFLMCVAMFGRGGIIASGVILLYFIFFNKKNKNIKLFILSLFVIGIVVNIDYITMFFIEKTNFSRGLTSIRSLMIDEYFYKMSLEEMFLGRKLSTCCPLISMYDGNPHNSFIAGHMRFGILHTLSALIILIYTLRSKVFIYIFLLLVLFFRFSLDRIGLFSTLDVPVFYILILIYSKRKYN